MKSQGARLLRRQSAVGRKRAAVILGALALQIGAANSASAGRFSFGNNVNGLNAAPGPASATLHSGGVNMHMVAGPEGALLRETNGPAGLGVDSSPLAPAVTDNLPFSMAILGGSGPQAGSGEYVEFWFDQPGMLTGLEFDGVKDELLEYFLLESTGGLSIYFFDSSANNPDVGHPLFERPLDAAIDAGLLTGDVVLLWEAAGLYSDDVHGLHIPFAAGQTFRLTFGAVAPPYAQGAPNGASLQGITVAAVPEPAAWLLAAAAGWALAIGQSRNRTLHDLRRS